MKCFKYQTFKNDYQFYQFFDLCGVNDTPVATFVTNVFFLILDETILVFKIKICRHPIMQKKAICGNLSGKALIKRQSLYIVICCFNIWQHPRHLLTASCGQFHQHYTREYFVQTSFSKYT